MSNLFSFSRRNTFLAAALALISGACGCRGPAAMKASFNQYSEAYASTVNEQMLLNLARRANGHPAYFLQMGLVNSTFSFSASGGGNVTSSRVRNQIGLNVITEALTGGGNFTLAAAETPTFTYTPLAGATFAQAIFAPISPVIFFNLLEQGRRVDLLMRAMVHAVDMTYVMNSGTNKVITVRNVLDPERQENYRNFLRLAGIYRELQKAELLTVRSSTNDVITFSFRPGYREKVLDIVKHPEFQFEPESEWAAALNPEETPKDVIPDVVLRLRTFEGVLTSLATEALTWQAVTGQGKPLIPNTQKQPILRLDGKELDPSTRVVDISYRGKKYQIADAMPEETWNRDVFNLLNHLYTQVSMDPNKLPVQQLIQVR